MWDVTEHWHACGPRDISSITTVWRRFSEGEGESFRESDITLGTLILSSDSERVAVITLGQQRDGSYMWVEENLAVFFSAADAANAGVLLPDDRAAIS